LGCLIELHENIDIAVLGSEVAAGSRAKKIKPPHMKATAKGLQFLPM
jgi:hypothetical protein